MSYVWCHVDAPSCPVSGIHVAILMSGSVCIIPFEWPACSFCRMLVMTWAVVEEEGIPGYVIRCISLSWFPLFYPNSPWVTSFLPSRSRVPLPPFIHLVPCVLSSWIPPSVWPPLMIPLPAAVGILQPSGGDGAMEWYYSFLATMSPYLVVFSVLCFSSSSDCFNTLWCSPYPSSNTLAKIQWKQENIPSIKCTIPIHTVIWNSQ